MVYIENNLVDSDGGMYLTVDSLIEINNIIIGSNSFNLRQVNVKPYGFDKMCMDKFKNQFNERKIAFAKFYSTLLNKIHSFYDGNRRTCKILFANDDINIYIYIHIYIYIYIIYIYIYNIYI